MSEESATTDKEFIDDARERKELKIEEEKIEGIKCKCGMIIPRGYGYYNYNQPIRCFNCGRINIKKI